MPDENSEKKLRTYKVLRPQPPTAAAFEKGDRFVRYAGLGEYKATDPDEAVEKAADEFPELEGGRFVVVALTGWQERDAIAETVRHWAVTRPERSGGEAARATEEREEAEEADPIGEAPTADDVSGSLHGAAGESLPPPTGEEPTVEQPTVEQPTEEEIAAAEDESASEVEQVAREAAENEGV